MPSTYKLRAVESACNSTPQDFGKATVVRLLETGTGNALITQKSNTAVVIGTLTIRQGTETVIVKSATDTLETAGAVLAVPVAYWS